MLPIKLYHARQLRVMLKEEEAIIVQITDPITYLSGHIPGAVLVRPQEIMSKQEPAIGKLPSEINISKVLAKIGYQADKTLIVYDNEGGGWAGRFLWILDCIGHKSLGYLNGGLRAWMAKHLPLETDWKDPPTTKVSIALKHQPIASLEDVKNAIDDPNQLIWDVRSEGEYRGADRRALRGGHIPSALHLDWSKLHDSRNHFCLPANLKQILRHNDLLSGKKIITHCQSHHRSGLSYLVGRLFQLDIRAYDGAGAEWGNKTDTPIEI